MEPTERMLAILAQVKERAPDGEWAITTDEKYRAGDYVVIADENNRRLDCHLYIGEIVAVIQNGLMLRKTTDRAGEHLSEAALKCIVPMAKLNMINGFLSVSEGWSAMGCYEKGIGLYSETRHIWLESDKASIWTDAGMSHEVELPKTVDELIALATQGDIVKSANKVHN